MEITEQIYCHWMEKYAGLEVDEIRQIKQLQDKNTRLKQIVTELTLDKTMLQDVLRKVIKPSLRRPLVKYLEQG